VNSTSKPYDKDINKEGLKDGNPYEKAMITNV